MARANPYQFYQPGAENPTPGGASGVGVTPPNGPGSTDPGTTGSTPTNPNDPVGGTIQTIADLISQGLSSNNAGATATPVVVPTSGGSFPILPLLLLVGLAVGIWFFMRKKKAE